MDKNKTFDNIDAATFDALLKQYPDIVPENLAELDEQRYNVIPEALKHQDGLSKAQIATLVDWKLSHGKFRPNLKAYVNQNTDSFSNESTTDAFKHVAGASSAANSIQPAFKILTKMKGIGPATASLLLSCYGPSVVPFFSDELFRWCFFEDGRGQGWDREIKYTMKEYLELFDKVQSFKTNFLVQNLREVSAVDMEKVAYVLGKRTTEGDLGGTGKKRKAGVALKGEHQRDLVNSVDHDPMLKKASDAPGQQGKKRTANAPSRRSKSEPVAKRGKTKTKIPTTMTAAASRPKRNAN